MTHIEMGTLLSQEHKQCQLFGNFGWFIQGILGVLSFSSLVSNFYLVKKLTEKNKRTWKIWFMDTSKQGFSSGILHILNLIVAYMIEHQHPDSNQCTWYFLNFAIDTFLGMAICYLLLNGLENAAARTEIFQFTSGFYGEPARWRAWAYQVSLWLLITLIMKTFLVGVVVLCHQALEFIGDLILSPIAMYPNLELMMVMIVIPIVLNSLMFWITDSFLKNTTKEVPKSAAISMELLNNDDVSTRDDMSVDDGYSIN